MMHVLLLLQLHVSMVRECDDNAGLGDRVGVVLVSAGHECVVHVVHFLCLVQLTC